MIVAPRRAPPLLALTVSYASQVMCCSGLCKNPTFQAKAAGAISLAVLALGVVLFIQVATFHALVVCVAEGFVVSLLPPSRASRMRTPSLSLLSPISLPSSSAASSRVCR